ncbi:MAG: HAD family phosphatase [Bacillota bacterium]|nr:HAD family phosphatase [Bacillota bacterium]
MTVIRGAIFDADGTLLDSMGMWDTVGARYLASLGVTARPGLRAILFPMTLAESAVYLKEAYGLAQSHQEIAEGINRTIRDFYRNEVREKPGAREFLEALRARGVGITLATNTDRSVIVEGLVTAGLLPLLDEIYTCGELGVGKDRPDIFHRARDRMGTRTEETWVFEDAVHCARTAFQAGYPVVGVADPFSDQEELKKFCHIYLPDLTDFDGFYQKAMK